MSLAIVWMVGPTLDARSPKLPMDSTPRLQLVDEILNVTAIARAGIRAQCGTQDNRKERQLRDPAHTWEEIALSE